MRSHVWMTIGLAAGLVLGLAAATTQHPTLITVATGLRPLGTLFLNLLSVELIPANPVRAAVDGNLLPLIVFTTICAVSAAGLPEEKRRTLTDVADVATGALIRIVGWVLLLAPLGIFALVAGAVAQFGWSLVKTMAVFVLAVIAGLAVFIAGGLLPAAIRGVRGKAARFLKASWPSMAMAFSTTSSLATLPTMLVAALEEEKVK